MKPGSCTIAIIVVAATVVASGHKDATPPDIFSMSNTKLGQGFCDDSGVRTHSYDCPPHIKYVKHIIYV